MSEDNAAKLSIKQLRAKTVFEQLIKDKKLADKIYDSFPESQSGKTISTDIARFLDNSYLNTPDGQPRDLRPGWDCAYKYSHDRFRRELKSRRDRKTVRFMSGGWAAGKTHAIKNAGLPGVDLTWDGTLKDTAWADRMIQLALQQKWAVEICYIYRSIEMSIYGAIERYKEEGRQMPLGELAGNHRDVQISISALVHKYHTKADVSFALFHNLGVKGLKGRSKSIVYSDIVSNGALHYTKAHVSYYQTAAKEIGSENI